MFRFLALGDSYTIGEGLSPADSWPAQLVHAMRQRDVIMEQAEMLATTGWTSGDLLQALQSAQLTPPYDLVTLLIGVNNQYQGLPLAAYQADFESLLKQAISLAGQRPERVVVMAIPDWGVTPYPYAVGRQPEQISAEIKAFNQINARLAYQQDLAYLNLNEQAQKAQRDPRLLAEDGLHYSRLMYTYWVKEQILPRVWRILLPGKNMHIPLLAQQNAAEVKPHV